MSKFLVTGASGFVGGHLVEALNRGGHQIRCLVRASSDVQLLKSQDIELINGELDCRDTLVRAVDGMDYVVHLAGRTNALDLDQLLKVNRDGTYYLAQACAAQSTAPVLVICSSIAASGPTWHGRCRLESDVPQPVSNYGISKRAAECAALLFADKVPVTIVRPGIVFGQRNLELLPVFQSMNRIGAHAVIGIASPRISMIHVDDLCQLMILAALQGTRVKVDCNLQAIRGEGIYYGVCSEYPTYAQLGSMLKQVFRKRGGRPTLIPSPLSWTMGFMMELCARLRGRQLTFNLDKVREAHSDNWACSRQNVTRDFQFTFPIPLQQRLLETANWYRDHQWL